jgi:hypothetical protein
MSSIKTGLENKVLVPGSVAEKVQGKHPTVSVIPDGNRAAILADGQVEYNGRSYLISIKGTGARRAMYDSGHVLLDGFNNNGTANFWSESWFGENPWGAMSRQVCEEDKAVTELADGNNINGFNICPMVCATPLPDWVKKDSYNKFWYRRLEREGPFYQQVRLMPSDIRLFYQSPQTLGKNSQRVLNAFDIKETETLDIFLENYIKSGIAALTLIPRTIRQLEEPGYTALDYDDVWLDKDSVVASDGTLFFADLEGLDWIPIKDENHAAKRIQRQFNRNYYEFMYIIDCLLQERSRLEGRPITREELRASLGVLLELALENDPYVELETNGDALNLKILHPENSVPDLKIKMLDFR